MPIYEFYCADCHTVFSFLSRTVNTSRRPDCPRCGRARLERKPSSFAVASGRSEPENGDDAMPDVDEHRLEQAMASIASDAERLDEDDPRQMARLMRKLYDSTGMRLGGGIEEAIRRMEAGEDPEKIEEELGDVMAEEDPFGEPGARKLTGALRGRLRPPSVDDTLYEL